MKITSINPATGETINIYEGMTPNELESTITQSHEAWQTWRTTTFGDRAVLMKETAKILRERVTNLGRLMAAEMGKPLKQGTAEVEKCAWACGKRRGSTRARRHQDRSFQVVCIIRAARRRACGNAVEFPAVAGLSVRRSRINGRQRWGA
jgi:acyl-CoA reductase-like NAD-dependent aldehyde dehydrogenase